MTMLQDGSYCFTPDRGGDTVSVLAVGPFAHVASVPLERLGDEPLEPYMATVSPRGDFLFVENARGDGSESILDVRDPTQPTEVARLTQADGLGLGAITSDFTPDGQFNCIICRDSSDLTVVNVDQLAVVGRVAFPEGSNPIAGTFTPSGDRFFVPLPGRDAVGVVSVPAFEVEQLVPVGPRPLGVVYLENPVPQRQGLYVPLGNSLEAPRVWPASCPDPCCGVIT
jgi:DNA-binding beta-propeller fold protein YncE